MPHQHLDIRTWHPVIQATKGADNSVTGLLQATFSVDLGCGHLEIFARSDAGIDFSFAGVMVPAVFLLPSYATDEPNLTLAKYLGSYVEKLHTRTLLFASRQFRAPPAVA